MKSLFACLAVLIATPSVAGADRIKIAVVPGIAVNIDAARIDALGQDLADALATELDIDAVGGLEMRRVLPAEGLPDDCVATPSCIADVARRVGASQLLFVVMVDTGGAIQIDSTWVQVSTGQTVSRPAIDLASIADARFRFAAAARQLLPDAPVRAKASPGGGHGGPIGSMKAEVPRHFTTASLATGGAAILGIGVGIGFGLSARSKYNACEVAPIDCDQSERDSIRHVSLLADCGWLLAIGGLVATGVLFTTSGEQAHFVVAPSADGVSLAAFGRF